MLSFRAERYPDVAYFRVGRDTPEANALNSQEATGLLDAAAASRGTYRQMTEAGLNRELSRNTV